MNKNCRVVFSFLLVFFVSIAFINFVPTSAKADQKIITWKMQSIAPPGTYLDVAINNFVETVKVMSQGRLNIEHFPPGSLVSPFEAMSALKNGILDAHWGYPAMWSGLNESASLFNSVPGGFLAQDALMWVKKGGGIELWNEMLAPYNVHIIPCGLIGMEVFMWSNKKIETIDDMKGLKLRIMPIMGDILSANGLSVTFLSASEIIPGLERKVIDAAEFSIPAFDITLGFPDVTKYYHYPGIHQPASVLELAIGKKSWEALPDDLKKIVNYAADLSILRIWTDSEADNINTLEKLHKMGLEQVDMNSEAVKTMVEWSEEWMTKKAQKNEFFKKVRKSQIDFAKWWYPYKTATSIPVPKWALE